MRFFKYGKVRGERFCQIYNIVKGGNFRDEATKTNWWQHSSFNEVH